MFKENKFASSANPLREIDNIRVFLKVPVWQHKYFVIKGGNGYPAAIHMAVFKDRQKIIGHNLIPAELKESTFCFDTLKEAEEYKCPCGKPNCYYGIYLLKSIMNFRNHMHKI